MSVRVWLEASGLQEWLAGRSFVLETVAIALVLLLLTLYGLPAIRRVWRLYVAFRTVPTDPDQHFLLGHSPRVSWERWQADRYRYNTFFHELELPYSIMQPHTDAHTQTRTHMHLHQRCPH